MDTSNAKNEVKGKAPLPMRYRITANNILWYLSFKGIITDFERVYDIPTFQRHQIGFIIMEKRKSFKPTTLSKRILSTLIKQGVITGFFCVKDIPPFVTEDMQKIIEGRVSYLGPINY